MGLSGCGDGKQNSYLSLHYLRCQIQYNSAYMRRTGKGIEYHDDRRSSPAYVCVLALVLEVVEWSKQCKCPSLRQRSHRYGAVSEAFEQIVSHAVRYNITCQTT